MKKIFSPLLIGWEADLSDFAIFELLQKFYLVKILEIRKTNDTLFYKTFNFLHYVKFLAKSENFLLNKIFKNC